MSPTLSSFQIYYKIEIASSFQIDNKIEIAPLVTYIFTSSNEEGHKIEIAPLVTHIFTYLNEEDRWIRRLFILNDKNLSTINQRVQKTSRSNIVVKIYPMVIVSRPMIGPLKIVTVRKILK